MSAAVTLRGAFSRMAVNRVLLAGFGSVVLGPVVALFAGREIAQGHGLFLFGLLGAGTFLIVTLAIPWGGVCVAIAMLMMLPAWETVGRAQLSVNRIAAVLAVAAVVAGARAGWRMGSHTVSDLGVYLILVIAFASWYLGPHYAVRLTLNPLLPLAFYFAGRRYGGTVAERIIFSALLASVGGALSVFYEFFVAGKPVFVDPTGYYWQAVGGNLFRPGGVFGSPPTAGRALMVVVLASLPLLSGPRKKVVAACCAVDLVAITVTFTRASMIGLVAGWVVYMALTRQLVKKAYFIALLGTIFAIIVMPRIGHTHVFERGVLRQGTFSARTTYWQQAWPIVGDSATHFIFGHGIDSLLPGGALLPTATPQPDIAIDPELYTHGPHNQYLRTLLETGVIGLAALLLWIVGAIGAGARVAIRQGDPFAASLVSALVAMALVATAGDAFRDQATLAITALLSGLVAARAVALKANGVQPLGTSAQVEPKVAG